MADRLLFKEKLDGIRKLAEEQGGHILLKDVEKYFAEDNLSEEQMGLVCEFLLSQKMVVTGYVKKSGNEPEEKEKEEERPLSGEEQAYVEEYLKTLDQMPESSVEEARMAYYLPKVVEAAMKLHRPEIFIGDMIQEGNISLMLALQKISQGADEEPAVMEAVRGGILAMIEAQNETRHRDNRMVEKVTELEETIQGMKEEFGRKVSIDEVAERLGISEDEIEDILKLAGEEVKDE